jgi:hypothetical protein
MAAVVWPVTIPVSGCRIHFVANRRSIKQFTIFLAVWLSGPVEDQTNLPGDFAFTLDFAPDDRWPGYAPGCASLQKGDPTPDLFTGFRNSSVLSCNRPRLSSKCWWLTTRINTILAHARQDEYGRARLLRLTLITAMRAIPKSEPGASTGSGAAWISSEVKSPPNPGLGNEGVPNVSKSRPVDAFP